MDKYRSLNRATGSLFDRLGIYGAEQLCPWSRRLEQMAKAIVQMERLTQSAVASAQQGASASEELTAQSLAVKQAVERLANLVELNWFRVAGATFIWLLG